jgi:hypothetical protein
LVARVVPHAVVGMNLDHDKPTWVLALEESLLLAIGLFSLITWVMTLGALAA